MTKKKSPEGEIAESAREIVHEIARWKSLRDNGGSDPMWADGANMNLVRNHVIYHKTKIRNLCEETGADYPEEYYLPLPPVVSYHYMANLNQKERVKRLEQFGEHLTRDAPEYDESQLSLL